MYNVVDWILDRILPLILIAVLVGFLSLPFLIMSSMNQQEEFMRECVKDHKKYECVAMWRAGRRSGYIIPMVVPVR